MHCVVIGAGWSGLAAAVQLSLGGHKVTLLESARQPGGRARRLSLNTTDVDNGQHLLIGAYHKTLELLNRIDTAESTVFKRLPLQLLMRQIDASACNTIDIRAARLPAPLHMLSGLITAKGLTARERWQAIRLCAALPMISLNDNDDCSVADVLLRHRQPTRLIEVLWEPLCLAIMNTPTALASASIFIGALRDAFLHKRNDSDFLVPIVDLGAVLPEPAIRKIQSLGGKVQQNSRVDELLLDGTQVTAAVLNDGSTVKADHFILATPPYAAHRLLEKHHLFKTTSEQLSQFKYSPIATVYLQYPGEISVSPPVMGMTGSIGQWLFDRRLCSQPGLMAVVISSHGTHEDCTTDELADLIQQELAQLFPRWPQPLWSQVIREKRATFLCEAGINRYRPENGTASNNTWLAGDYTDTGYPATLEGAIRSGLDCATAVDMTTG